METSQVTKGADRPFVLLALLATALWMIAGDVLLAQALTGPALLGPAVTGQRLQVEGQLEENASEEAGECADVDQEPEVERAWTGDLELGGNARFFLFEITEDFAGRNDIEQAALRLTLEHELTSSRETAAWSGMRFEVHGVLSGTSPIAGGFSGSGVTSSGTQGHRRVDLQKEVQSSDLQEEDIRLWAEIDRLNVRFEHQKFSLTLGRQPITWGVNYFWPVIDLFGPFSPAAIDRDYKPGVDAVRLNLPVGDFSEVELIAAAQGDEATGGSNRSQNDWSYGALGRFHVKGTDVGFLIGDFYRDTMAGIFVTGDMGGFGLRGEALYTDVAEEWLGLPGETSSSFWRATVGVDRLLSPRASLVTEISFNGFGGRSAQEYPLIAASNRFQRGEITSLGREYSGVSFSFQVSPLWTVAAAVLTNWGDGSTLLQPSLAWSVSDNSSVSFGAFVGFGDEFDMAGGVASEYGVVPVTLWGSIRTYF